MSHAASSSCPCLADWVRALMAAFCGATRSNRGGVQQLGKNIKGYSGETIDIAAVLRDCVAAAQTHGWSHRGDSPCPKTHHGASLAMRHAPRPPSPAHATEDGNPQHAFTFPPASTATSQPGLWPVRQLLRENAWPAGFGHLAVPVLEPDGLRAEPPGESGGPGSQPPIPRSRGRGDRGSHRVAEAPAALRSVLVPPRRLGVARILPV